MKKSFVTLIIPALCILLAFSSCKKNETEKSLDEMLKNQEPDIELASENGFEKIITNPLVKMDNCKYIVAGTIEYWKNGNLLATVDFGEGSCDNVATKTIGDKMIEFSLDKTDKDSKYKKVIAEPLVKTDACAFVVSGIIDFYEGGKWVATIDYGDGTCDDIATKYWEGGSKDFSLSKN